MYEPEPVIPEETPDLSANLRLPAAEFELNPSSLMLLAVAQTGNRHAVILRPVDALKIPNYRTFSLIAILDATAAAAL